MTRRLSSANESELLPACLSHLRVPAISVEPSRAFSTGIAAELGVNPNRGKGRRRFVAKRLDGLFDEP
jgi:hypothetical protein